MEKRQILVALHQLASHRLFGESRWPADPDTCASIHQKLDEWGLQERVSSDTWAWTALGHELDVALMMVFAGFMGEGDSVHYLEQYGLIDGFEAVRLVEDETLYEDPGQILRPVVQKAYHKHFAVLSRLQ